MAITPLINPKGHITRCPTRRGQIKAQIFESLGKTIWLMSTKIGEILVKIKNRRSRNANKNSGSTCSPNSNTSVC